MSRAPAAGKRKPQEDVPEPEDNYQQEESVLTESTDSSEDENAEATKEKTKTRKSKASILRATYRKTVSLPRDSSRGPSLPATSSSVRHHKREPLPMKLRALPQSFWQQPNNAATLSPAELYPVLPPLLGVARDPAECTGDEQLRRQITVSPANTDLLFSLFRGVDEAASNANGLGSTPVGTFRSRGRPRKPPGAMVAARLLRRDQDPCLVSTAVADSILPLISDGGTRGGAQPVLTMVSLTDGDKTISLPSLNFEHNYSQILSELVIKL